MKGACNNRSITVIRIGICGHDLESVHKLLCNIAIPKQFTPHRYKYTIV